MTYSTYELEQALEQLWDAFASKASQSEQDKMRQSNAVIDEVAEYGSKGPAGIGLGNYGGHCFGEDDISDEPLNLKEMPFLTNDWYRTKYYEQHKYCPTCSGNHFETTTMTWIGGHDLNNTKCLQCGWQGKVDDRVP